MCDAAIVGTDGTAGSGHWEDVYRDRVPEMVSWYRQEPAMSLRLLGRTRRRANRKSRWPVIHYRCV